MVTFPRSVTRPLTSSRRGDPRPGGRCPLSGVRSGTRSRSSGPGVAIALWKIDGDTALEEAGVATIAAMADRHWDFMGSQSPRCRIIGDCLARIGARTLPLILPRLD